jgi:hypothetical protein
MDRVKDGIVYPIEIKKQVKKQKTHFFSFGVKL